MREINYPETFATFLTLAMDNLDLKKRELAYRFQVSPSTISRWASGEVTPSDRICALVRREISQIYEMVYD